MSTENKIRVSRQTGRNKNCGKTHTTEASTHSLTNPKYYTDLLPRTGISISSMHWHLPEKKKKKVLLENFCFLVLKWYQIYVISHKCLS